MKTFKIFENALGFSIYDEKDKRIVCNTHSEQDALFIKDALDKKCKNKTGDIILGQEAICPHGLGRVVEFKDQFPENWVRVDTYVNNRSCKWDRSNVTLVLPIKEN